LKLLERAIQTQLQEFVDDHSTMPTHQPAHFTVLRRHGCDSITTFSSPMAVAWSVGSYGSVRHCWPRTAVTSTRSHV